MDDGEQIKHLIESRAKCRFVIRKELTFSALAIIAFTVTYQEDSSIPFLSSIVVYSFLLSGFFSIMLLHAWERSLNLLIAKKDGTMPRNSLKTEETTMFFVNLCTYLYKSLYAIGVISAVIMYATS